MNIVIKIDASSGKNRGYAFLYFVTYEAAEKATKEEQIINDRNIDCEFANDSINQKKNRIDRITNTKLFVNYIKHCVETEEFFNYFNQFGQMKQYYIVFDPKTGKSKGYGFLRYLHQEDALKVQSQEHTLAGKKMAIERFDPLMDKEQNVKPTKKPKTSNQKKKEDLQRQVDINYFNLIKSEEVKAPIKPENDLEYFGDDYKLDSKNLDAKNLKTNQKFDNQGGDRSYDNINNYGDYLHYDEYEQNMNFYNNYDYYNIHNSNYSQHPNDQKWQQYYDDNNNFNNKYGYDYYDNYDDRNKLYTRPHYQQRDHQQRDHQQKKYHQQQSYAHHGQNIQQRNNNCEYYKNQLNNPNPKNEQQNEQMLQNIPYNGNKSNNDARPSFNEKYEKDSYYSEQQNNKIYQRYNNNFPYHNHQVNDFRKKAQQNCDNQQYYNNTFYYNPQQNLNDKKNYDTQQYYTNQRGYIERPNLNLTQKTPDHSGYENKTASNGQVSFSQTKKAD